MIKKKKKNSKLQKNYSAFYVKNISYILQLQKKKKRRKFMYFFEIKFSGKDVACVSK